MGRNGKCKLIRRILLVFVGVLFLTVPATPRDSASALPSVDLNGVTSNMVVAGGRGFTVYVPPGLPLPAPVIITLHGHKGVSASWDVPSFAGVQDHANKLGFVEVGANGIGASWNAEICCDPARQDNVNDEQYIKNIRTELVLAGIADPNRVFTLGYSNGDMLGMLLNCRLPTLFAGHAGSSGDFPPATPTWCGGARVLHFHGNQDPTVTIGGGWEPKNQMTTSPISTIPDRMRGAEVVLHFADCGHVFPTSTNECGYDGVNEAWSFFNP